jgi:hypothetical protein
MAEKCTGRGKVTKKPCGNSPMKGANVCRMHGGGTPQARAKAKERRAVRSLLNEVDPSWGVS